MIGCFVAHSAPAREQYARIRISQWPEQDEIELPTFVNNTEFIFPAGAATIGVTEPAFFPLGGVRAYVGQDFSVKGISAGGDIFTVAIVMRYGQSLGPVDMSRGKIIVRYLNKGSDSTAGVWTDVSTISDLDPLKTYNVIGFGCLPEDADTAGCRLDMPETGAKPGVGVVPWFIFPEVAAVITGNSDPTLQSLVQAANEPDHYVILQERTSGGVPYEGGTGAQMAQTMPGLFGGLFGNRR